MKKYIPKYLFFSLFVLSTNAQTFVVPKLHGIGSKKQLQPDERKSSFPYISGDTFRVFASHVIDEIKIPFDPQKLRAGDTIFLNAYYMDYFFGQVHPAIDKPYILITHNSDSSVPKKYSYMLDSSKIIAWFTTNMSCEHPKLFPIPIGFANAHWPHGDISIIEEVISMDIQKDKLCYVNFEVKNNPRAREKVYKHFKGKSFCYSTGRKNYRQYLHDLARSKFVVSPLGNGLDCHRTWEALLMGAIPIIESSTIDSLFADLPVIIVKNWAVITQEFLEKKYHEMQAKDYNYEKLYAQYWFDQITGIQKKYRDKPCEVYLSSSYLVY